jgi:hypothetical protein
MIIALGSEADDAQEDGDKYMCFQCSMNNDLKARYYLGLEILV